MEQDHFERPDHSHHAILSSEYEHFERIGAIIAWGADQYLNNFGVVIPVHFSSLIQC
jgi:hypothetical protein